MLVGDELDGPEAGCGGGDERGVVAGCRVPERAEIGEWGGVVLWWVGVSYGGG